MMMVEKGQERKLKKGKDEEKNCMNKTGTDVYKIAMQAASEQAGR